jgi:hypothetical protein
MVNTNHEAMTAPKNSIYGLILHQSSFTNVFLPFVQTQGSKIRFSEGAVISLHHKMTFNRQKKALEGIYQDTLHSFMQVIEIHSVDEDHRLVAASIASHLRSLKEGKAAKKIFPTVSVTLDEGESIKLTATDMPITGIFTARAIRAFPFFTEAMQDRRIRTEQLGPKSPSKAPKPSSAVAFDVSGLRPMLSTCQLRLPADITEDEIEPLLRSLGMDPILVAPITTQEGEHTGFCMVVFKDCEVRHIKVQVILAIKAIVIEKARLSVHNFLYERKLPPLCVPRNFLSVQGQGHCPTTLQKRPHPHQNPALASNFS